MHRTSKRRKPLGSEIVQKIDIGGTSLEELDKYWPKPLEDAAFVGVLGDFVRTVEPHTEADPAALLVQMLVAAGNVVGSSPHVRVEAERHRMNLFAAVV